MSYLNIVMDWLIGASSQILYNAIIAFLLISLGVALGFLVKGILMHVLRGVKLDEFVNKVHIKDVFGKLSVSEVFADIAEIAIIITFTVQALSVLGWVLIADALATVLYWIPGVIAALVIFLVFYALAKSVQLRMLHSDASWNVRLAPIVMGFITFFGAIVALDQIGLDTSLIKQALLILIFGLALAFALAVGIAAGFGLKDEAAQLVRTVSGKSARKPVKRTATKTASKRKPSRAKKR